MQLADDPPRRIRIRITGTVQGVGFRPFVHNLAHRLGIAGWIRNDAAGVTIEAEAEGAVLDALVVRLRRDAPPLARIEDVAVESVVCQHQPGFTIHESHAGGGAGTPVAPDSATCDACVTELFDPADRRFRYPFLNCTDCGPRFTITCRVPWDRPNTTMAGFAMCADCRREYDDPANRRFHAQPNACAVCGPQLRLIGADAAPTDDALAATAQALVAGAIVAIKGLGGFHLACRADDEAAVARLRARKHREEKPFALLVRDLAAAATLVHVDGHGRTLLTSPARPIVLAPRRRDAAVAESVAPRAPELGVMLPYSPLHHLLAADLARMGVAALVMTSGNVADEPIAFENDDACVRLAAIADLFLVHDRPIRTRTDDSVARIVRVDGSHRPQILRRARGWVPERFTLPLPTPLPILACGADLKNALCLAKSGDAWLGPHVGDLETEASLGAFADGITHLWHLFAIEPEVVAHDLHPDFHSTRFAQQTGLPRIAVQHHHAHFAACLAEHGETGPALGVIFDGMGWGTDGTVWGGEFLAGDLASVERVGHLHTVPLPGGDRASREPWRMACSWLQAAFDGAARPPLALQARIDPGLWRNVEEIARRGIAAPATSSVGRLFDAVAALCGLHTVTTWEGQAAIALEAAADPDDGSAYPLPVVEQRGMLVLDARPAIRDLVTDLTAGVAPGRISARFHEGLAAATATAALRLCEAHGLDRIVLSGGVFQNRRLLAATSARLGAAGRTVLVARQLPVNDGAIAFGQAAVAAALLARSRGR
jgi:hydrogenase maturation protein HypF